MFYTPAEGTTSNQPEQADTLSSLAYTSAETDLHRSTPQNKAHPHIEGGRPETIRVLLVDDHALIREGLHQLLEQVEDIEVVGEATDGIEVKAKIRQLHPDVILMDIYMPIVNGLAITKQISQEFPDISVIMLTMHHQNQQVLQAMRNGAKGYLLKSASIREVVHAIHTVYEGGIALEPEMTGTIVNEFRRISESTSTSQGVEALVDKEIEIIRYVAQGLSNREIAEKLAYSEKTVKNYLSIIFQKLHLRDRTQVAIFALRHGLLASEDNEG